MEPRKLVIVVCCSDRWIQVPVGTFGISSFLGRHGIQHHILHTSMQTKEESELLLEKWINEGYSFALVLQWKENTPTFYTFSHFLKSRIPDPMRVICGGITASFFCQEILSDPMLPDIVIRGDAEHPLLDYCQNKPVPDIENTAYSENGVQTIKPITHRIDTDFFSALSFTDLSRLHNADKFLAAANRRYLHINITRGCAALCDYCGGSQFANIQHSDRSTTLKRSAESVVADIIQLCQRTKSTSEFINMHLDDFWENYHPVLAKLVDPEIKRRINLSICERGALDIDNIKNNIDIFNDFNKVTFEISPESDDEEQRRAMMAGTNKHLYTQDEIIRISNYLTSVDFNVLIFYTLYNFRDTQETVFKRCEFYEKLKEALASPRIGIICSGFSLDCGSADYCSLPDPPALSDYRSPDSRFTNLLGNISYVRKPADLDYLIAAKFFLVMVDLKGQPARRSFIARPHYTLQDILGVVKKHKLATLINHDFVLSGKYVPFISEKLLEQKFR